MRPVFRFSIALNVLLLGALAVLLWRDRPGAKPATTPAPEAVVGPRALDPAVAQAPPGEPRRDAPPLGPAVFAQLERAGISRAVLISALREESNRRWDRRLRELEQHHAPRQVPEREYIEFGRLREAEQARELKAALGEEGFLAWDREQTLRAVNSAELAITAEEADRAYRLQKEFDETHRELQRAMEDGIADRADAATLQAQAQATLERELEQLFGRDRLNALRGITDPIANVHWRYGELNPTPEQASAVVRADEAYRSREAALARQLRETPAGVADPAAELQALGESHEEELRRIFGAAAYDAAKRQSDPTYQTLTQFAATWALRDDEVQSVYQSLGALHDQVERTRSAAAMREAAGQPVNWREIDASLEQARQQAEAGLQSLLGDERLHRLKQNGLLTHR